MQYVEIPQLRIETTSNAANIRRARGRVPRPDGIGRTDLLCVFNGLREKKVNTILKVIVDDLVEPSHSDEAIEKALEKMGVEIWDWKKIDLCTEVIQKAAPNVREVHLYWSGNNALLRGWSEEGGLKRLKELAKVHLHVQQVCRNYDVLLNRKHYSNSLIAARVTDTHPTECCRLLQSDGKAV